MIDRQAETNSSEFRHEGQDLSLEIAVLRNALLAGAENVVYMLIAVSSRTVDANDESASAPGQPEIGCSAPTTDACAGDSAASSWPAFSEMAVRLKVPRGATYGFLRLLTRADGIWNPPDLFADTQCIGLARVVLPAALIPSFGESARVTGLRLQGVPLTEQGVQVIGRSLVLPVVKGDEYAASAEDEFVPDLLDEPAAIWTNRGNCPRSCIATKVEAPKPEHRSHPSNRSRAKEMSIRPGTGGTRTIVGADVTHVRSMRARTLPPPQHGHAHMPLHGQTGIGCSPETARVLVGLARDGSQSGGDTSRSRARWLLRLRIGDSPDASVAGRRLGRTPKSRTPYAQSESCVEPGAPKWRHQLGVRHQ